MGNLGEFELLTLLAIARLEDNAYGVTIRDLLESATSRTVTLGSIYKTLGRLEAKGLIRATVAPPTGERGGRRKKLYRPSARGTAAMRSSLGNLGRLAKGLEFDSALP